MIGARGRTTGVSTGGLRIFSRAQDVEVVVLTYFNDMKNMLMRSPCESTSPHYARAPSVTAILAYFQS
jgi:hypothetical protein